MTINPPSLWPQPGSYRDISFVQYRALDAVCASDLKVIAADSPAHLQHQRLYPKRSDALDEGRAVHTFILEPQRFWSPAGPYLLTTTCCETVKTGKSAGLTCKNDGIKVDGDGRWFCGVHGKSLPDVKADIVTPDLYQRLKAMHAAVYGAADSAELMADVEERELSVIWKDPGTGLLCKMRCDAVRNDALDICDLKKARSAYPRKFLAQSLQLQYPTQAAWYLRGADAAWGKAMRLFKFIAIEDNANMEMGGPHAVNVFVAGETFTRLGNIAVESSLAIYANCKKSGIWPGYSGVKMLEVSERQIEWQELSA